MMIHTHTHMHTRMEQQTAKSFPNAHNHCILMMISATIQQPLLPLPLPRASTKTNTTTITTTTTTTTTTRTSTTASTVRTTPRLITKTPTRPTTPRATSTVRATSTTKATTKRAATTARTTTRAATTTTKKATTRAATTVRSTLRSTTRATTRAATTTTKGTTRQTTARATTKAATTRATTRATTKAVTTVRATTKATTRATTRTTTRITTRATTKAGTTARTTAKTTTKATTRTSTTRATTRPGTTPRPTTRRARRDAAGYRQVMLAGSVCVVDLTPTSLDVIAVQALTGQVIANFSVQLVTTTFTTPLSAWPNCDAAACAAPCARFVDGLRGCRVCVCNPTPLSATAVRGDSGFASFALGAAGMHALQASAGELISPLMARIVLTRRLDAGLVIPLFPYPLPSGSAALTVLVTLTWLDTGLPATRDFDSLLRTSFAQPTPAPPVGLCTVAQGSNCNQGDDVAEFTTSNARVGLFPAPYAGAETIRITATTGLFQHVVYNHAFNGSFTGSNARVQVLVLNAEGMLVTSAQLDVDVDGATATACGRRRFWNTFLIDLRTTPTISSVNTLTCDPTASDAFAAFGVFPSFPNENGERTCC
eukprot:m.128323 g.128323  ORF g.128323 m.128323 type:complete len:598 (+) comp14728_c3_seq1:422-2215(+)